MKLGYRKIIVLVSAVLCLFVVAIIINQRSVSQNSLDCSTILKGSLDGYMGTVKSEKFDYISVASVNVMSDAMACVKLGLLGTKEWSNEYEVVEWVDEIDGAQRMARALIKRKGFESMAARDIGDVAYIIVYQGTSSKLQKSYGVYDISFGNNDSGWNPEKYQPATLDDMKSAVRNIFTENLPLPQI